MVFILFFQGAGVVPNLSTINSSEAFKDMKCDTNSSRFVNINFTLTYLLSNESVEFNLTTSDGYTIYHQEAGDKNSLEELFLLGTSFVNSAITTVKGENTVILTANGNDSTKAEFNIKEKKVIAEIQDISGTNMCTTVAYGNVTGTRLIVDQSADAVKKDDLGLAPMHWAAMFGDTMVIRQLLQRGSDVDVKWTRESATPLHFAAIRGDKDVVKTLLDNGANIEARDVEDMSVLDAAIYSNKSEIVKQLIDLGANLTTENPSGRTSLHIAAERGNKDIINLLIDNGMDVNAKDQEGRSPLNVAIEFYEADTVQQLVDRGAQVDFPELVKLYGDKKIYHLLGNNSRIVE